MSNPSKQKGTKAETRVVRYLETLGIEAHRKALTGSNDEGDVELPQLGVILEVKAGKQTQNYNRALLDDWLNQTIVEAKNAGRQGFLVIARYNRSPDNYEVWSRHHKESKMTMQFLDDWAKEKSKIVSVK